MKYPTVFLGDQNELVQESSLPGGNRRSRLPLGISVCVKWIVSELPEVACSDV
jgi:hypothetical protein